MTTASDMDIPTGKGELFAEYRRLAHASWLLVAIWKPVPAEQVARAEEALREMFAKAGIAPVEVAQGATFYVEWDQCGRQGPRPAQMLKHLYEIWVGAHALAYKTATGEEWPGDGVDLFPVYDKPRLRAVLAAIENIRAREIVEEHAAGGRKAGTPKPAKRL